MARLTPRYTSYELERLVEAIYPEEDRFKFTDQPWIGEGFRHYRDPKIVCLEHYMPKDQPIRPTAVWGIGRKPAA
jgi:hypothetical protein